MSPSTARARRRRRGLGIAALVACAVVAVNALAYRHAYAMLHVAPAGRRPPHPESLTFAQTLRVLFLGIDIPRALNRETPADRGLAFSTCIIPVNPQVRLEAWYLPVLDPSGMVVLFHGYQASKESLLTEAAAYHGMGYACLLVDFRGSGGSSGNLTTIGYREAEDVAAALPFARGLIGAGRPVILHGQSMGAAAILRAVAVDHIRPDAVVLEAVFDRMLTTTRNRFRLMHVPSFPAAELLLFWGGWQCGFNAFRHNPVAYARDVRVPALVMGGTADARALPAEVRRVFDALAGPKQLVFFRAGHESFAAAFPRKWQFVVDGFLHTQVNMTDLQDGAGTQARRGSR